MNHPAGTPAPVMNMLLRGPCLLVLLSLVTACQSVPETRDVTRIAFGSCNRSDLPQPLWNPIIANDPDLWIWAGDNVYGDTEDMHQLAAKYAEQRQNPGYGALVARTPVVGTWDDHDYGANDAGAEYPRKSESQQLFLDFLGVPQDDPRRRRQGIYSSHVLGEGTRQVKVILLDVRYHREKPGPEADILGEEQWRWLAEELAQSEARVNLIVSGTQVLPREHEWERWAAYPAARQRLLDLIVGAGKPGVILLSGDRHFAELTVNRPEGFYPLYEVTSSGLTHFWEQLEGETNLARMGRLYKGLNFGLVEIDWSANGGAVVSLQVRDKDNRSRVRVRFPLARLAVAD